jgi:hypothetical protein
MRQKINCTTKCVVRRPPNIKRTTNIGFPVVTHACSRPRGRVSPQGRALAAQGATMRVMAAQDHRWTHSDGDGGEGVLRVIRAATSPNACARSPPIHSSRVISCFFEGLTVGGGRELAARRPVLTRLCGTCTMSGMAVQWQGSSA